MTSYSGSIKPISFFALLIILKAGPAVSSSELTDKTSIKLIVQNAGLESLFFVLYCRSFCSSKRNVGNNNGMVHSGYLRSITSGLIMVLGIPLPIYVFISLVIKAS